MAIGNIPGFTGVNTGGQCFSPFATPFASAFSSPLAGAFNSPFGSPLASAFGSPFGSPSSSPFFPPFFNQAILVVRAGGDFFQVFVFDGIAQAIQISAAQAAFLQQFGVPCVSLT